MRWTRGCFSALWRADEGIFSDGQAVWSCPPDAGVKLCGTFRRATETNSPVLRGERGATVNTIARGMPVVPAEPVLLACVMRTLFCTQGSRVRPASGIPRALFYSRAMASAALGQIMPRECEGACFSLQNSQGGESAAKPIIPREDVDRFAARYPSYKRFTVSRCHD